MSTVTEVVTHLVTTTIKASATPSSTLRAPPQGGILEGGNPSVWDKKNPIILFIIQAGIIVIFCRLLHYPLSLIRQPRVIAEVIGGILLGPSVMGRIPGFSNHIFPTDSIPSLNLVANLGLVLFLFLVGLEVDLRYFISNWRPALTVGAAGMALPFGLGCAVAWGLHEQFPPEHSKPIAFGTFMLFVGVAMAITAFPVLCRILTELKLLETPVGIIVLSAGVGNDVVGWILLALCVALVNAGSGLTALWVLLCCVGYALFLAFAVRPVFLYILRRNGSLQNGPSQSMVALTLLIALSSAFFTGIIGVHPIFGGFMAGLICPHEGAFRVKVVEKIEDLVGAIFLPLYFALSGLSTNIGLLNTGIIWAYVIAIIAVAFSAKFIGGTLAARLTGCIWRESCTIGVLMSCKGLVELIVLNVGLQAGILTQQTFTMFVVMALVTTFATTPLTSWLYPLWYQQKVAAWRRGEIDWDTGASLRSADANSDVVMNEKLRSTRVKTLLLYLRLDTLPALISFVSLLGGKQQVPIERTHAKFAQASPTDPIEDAPVPRARPVVVHGVRLMELDDRNSSVMMVSETEEYGYLDPVINAFRVLGQLYNLAVSGEVSIIPENSHANTLSYKAVEASANMLLVPWSETGTMSENLALLTDNVQDKMTSESYSSFVLKTFDTAPCDVAVFVNNGFSGNLAQRHTTLTRSVSNLSMRNHHIVQPRMNGAHHIFMPYFGGPDDQSALRLVLQLVENPEVTATIIHYNSVDTTDAVSVEQTTIVTKNDQNHTSGRTSVITSERSTHGDDAVFFNTLKGSLPVELEQRVVFENITTAAPVAEAVLKAQSEIAQTPKNQGDLIIVGRHINYAGARNPMDSSSVSCLGFIAGKMLSNDVRASIVVVQAFERKLES